MRSRAPALPVLACLFLLHHFLGKAHYPTIPLSHYPTIPLSHYPTIPLSHYPTIPLSRLCLKSRDHSGSEHDGQKPTAEDAAVARKTLVLSAKPPAKKRRKPKAKAAKTWQR